MRVLELFSGIGGMHWALKETGIEYEVVAAIDINPTCNYVYHFNFPNTNLVSKCLTSLRVDHFRRLDIEAVLMSPPCQPYSSLGNQADVDDPRATSFRHFMQILKMLDKPPKYILLENVKPFYDSKMRRILLQTLEELHYNIQEYLLCPSQFGIPNSRKRYYLMAKLKPLQFAYHTQQLITELPDRKMYRYKAYDNVGGETGGGSIGKDGGGEGEDGGGSSGKDGGGEGEVGGDDLIQLERFLQLNEPSDYLEQLKVPKRFFKKFWLMDLTQVHSTSCCCFTKGYGRYIEKAGSIFQTHPATVNLWPYKGVEGHERFVEEVERLGLRFFSPREVANFMTFPPEFKFPPDLKPIQCYKLMGNSVNVHVISCLIRILFNKI